VGADTPKRRTTDDPKEAGKPGFITIEEMLLSRNYEVMQESVTATKTQVTWTKVVALTVGIVFVLVIALQVQVYLRNQQIDKVQRIACGFAQFIPEQRRGDTFDDCDNLDNLAPQADVPGTSVTTGTTIVIQP
jgi:type II secretory pathway component PulL